MSTEFLYLNDVVSERPASEGDLIKASIRELFEISRTGVIFTETQPLKKPIHNVNGSVSKTLNLCKHPSKNGAIIMWYE